MLRTLAGLPLTCGVFLGEVPAQDQDRIRDEEAVDYYRKWLDEDVRYIISPQERAVFESLTTPEEKEHFIEQFWFRRDPDPSTAANEFREEHYRRIAYANEHFDEGTDGWLTDRGRIYIIHGPPDEIESHEAGEVAYDRRPEEGGGTTSTYPFIRWWYRHIDGVGDDVTLEFVDRGFTGAYRLTMNPWEKDALFYTPYGATWAEEGGLSSRLERYHYDPLRADPFRNYRAQDNPFEKYRRFIKAQAPPPVKYRDFERLVDVQITYEQLPLRSRLDYLRLDDDYALIPVTVRFDNQFLTFEKENEVYVARMGVYGRVTSLSGRVMTKFEDDLLVSYRPEFFEKGRSSHSMYQKVLTLPEGQRYKLDLVVKDLKSGKVGILQQAILPPSRTDRLSSSSLILANSIRTLQNIPQEETMFVLGDVWVRPKVDNLFRRSDQLAAYLQLYHFAIDQSRRIPSLRARFRIVREGETVREVVEENGESVQYFSPRRIVLIHLFPLKDLPSGGYTLQVEVHDRIRDQKVKLEESFQIQAGPEMARTER